MPAKDLTVVRDDSDREPKEFNAWRLVAPDEKTVLLELGRVAGGEVHVVFSAKFHPRMLRRLIGTFYSAGIAFEKKYGTDLGFSGGQGTGQGKNAE